MVRRLSLSLAISLALSLALGCGAAAPQTTTTARTPATDPPAPVAPLAPFAGHGPLVLRSRSPERQPPLYAELTADGSVTGTRCSATRFTDDGTLEREGAPVARVDPDEDGFVISTPNDPLGWRIDEATLTTRGDTRFTYADGTITSTDAELPVVLVDPADADPSLVLALFATLLVCDDVGP
jgi:hypothetical protein